MWPDDRLTSLLGIQHPIIQAPMLGSVSPDLVAAVSNAGALGSFACGAAKPGDVPNAMEALGGLTNRPFNLNFFAYRTPRVDSELARRTIAHLAPRYDAAGIAPPDADLGSVGPGFTDDVLQDLLAHPPRVVSFHFGLPEPAHLAALKRAGVILLCSATKVSEAKALEDAGVDAIIAQGWEAGGHRGAFEVEGPDVGIGLFSLVPQIADAVSVPVIAAGGIADGRGIAAAFALGASGVQIGTAFLTTPEAATKPRHREALVKADETDTLLSRAVSGRPARALRTPYLEEMAARGPMPEYPQMYALSRPLQAAAGAEYDFLLYGQSAGMSREMPAAQLVETLTVEALERMGRSP